MNFVHFCCMECTAEGFFVVPENWKEGNFKIFCPHCGKELSWEYCNIEKDPKFEEEK